jgi:hypothetical protein
MLAERAAGAAAYTFVRCMREIGIRMAIGATAGDVGWLVLRKAMAIAVRRRGGRAARHVVARPLRGEPALRGRGEPVTLVSAALSPGAVSALAALLPSARAARLEPTIALRCE